MPPFYDPRGWMQWPGHDECSFQFLRVLGAAQEGGSTISECLLTASAIDPACEDSWHRQWMRVADFNRQRGETAFAAGHVKTALSNWLRAANYYRTALAFVGDRDVRNDRALEHMHRCSQLYLMHSTPAGVVVDLALPDGRVMQGYFLPAPGRSRRPVVICIAAPDHYKEDHLYRMPRYAHERGLSLLLVDLPGHHGSEGASGRKSGRYEIEAAISSWVDYLVERPDVDQNRIAVFGDGLGAAFATRCASFDDRFKAAVCDAGIWDLHERAFLAARPASNPASLNFAEHIDRLTRSNTAQNIRCPILVALGEHDWLDAGHVARCCDALIADGLKLDLKIFSASETAASHAQRDNPTIGSEFIFDWIADQLVQRKK